MSAQRPKSDRFGSVSLTDLENEGLLLSAPPHLRDRPIGVQASVSGEQEDCAWDCSSDCDGDCSADCHDSPGDCTDDD